MFACTCVQLFRKMCYRVRSCVVVACAGHVKTMATDQWAHLVLITALTRVDDTALLRKHVISDLQASWLLLPTLMAGSAPSVQPSSVMTTPTGGLTP